MPGLQPPPPHPYQDREWAERLKEAHTVKVPSWPQQHEWKTYWTTLCDNLASASSIPHKAWLLIRAVAKALTIEELEDDVGFETLWAKLRVALMDTFKINSW